MILISGRLGIVQTEVEAVLALLWREQHDKVVGDKRFPISILQHQTGGMWNGQNSADAKETLGKVLTIQVIMVTIATTVTMAWSPIMVILVTMVINIIIIIGIIIITSRSPLQLIGSIITMQCIVGCHFPQLVNPPPPFPITIFCHWGVPKNFLDAIASPSSGSVGQSVSQ